MDNSNNTEIKTLEQGLIHTVDSLQETRMPENRVYDALLNQLENLADTIGSNRGKIPNLEDVNRLETRYDTAEKLAEIYLQSKADRLAVDPEELEQIETVRNTRDYIGNQKESILRYKNLLAGQTKNMAGSDEERIRDRVEKMETESRFLTGIIRQSTEKAVSSLDLMSKLYQSKLQETGGKSPEQITLNPQEKELVRYAMATVSMHEKIVSMDADVKALGNYARREGDYKKLVTLVADSDTFKEVSESRMNGKEIRNFLVEHDSGKKLWDSFEAKVKLERANNKLTSKEGGKEKDASRKPASNGNSPKKEDVKKEPPKPAGPKR